MTKTPTTGATDRRMATPTELGALISGLTVEELRGLLDAAADVVTELLDRPPWRLGWNVYAEGSDDETLVLPVFPVEELPIVTRDGAAVDGISLRGRRRDRLYREGGWPERSYRQPGVTLNPLAQTELEDYLIVITAAGYLMPGQVSTWAATTDYQTEPASISYDDPATGSPYAAGAWVRSSDPRVDLRFECTEAGTSGATEPVAFTASSTVADDEIADGTVTWTARNAVELPAALSKDALKIALWIHETSDETQDPKVEEMMGQGGKLRIEHFGSVHEIPPSAVASLRSYL